MFIEKLFHPPVYVYQMGKVGSTSVERTLRENYPGAVVHSHNYHRMWRRDRLFLSINKLLGRSVKIICPVREPISRNVSAFFQTFKRDTGFELSQRDWTTEELLDLFLNQYPHSEPFDWFDTRFKPIFGLDVFAEPFPVGQKFKFYRKGPVEILIYRSDLDRTTQLQQISKLMGQEFVEWTYANIGKEKSYSKLYKRFCNEVRLPDDYLDGLINSRLARHFWSASELEQSAARWRAG